MNKLITISLLCGAVFTSAQVSIAAKANAIIPTSSASWQNFKTGITNSINQEGKNVIGFNAGLSLKIDLPTALYIMPEVYYSNFKNEVEVLNDISGVQTTIDAKTSRVDVPVLVGYKILKNTLSAFAGPVGSINLVKDDNYDSFVQKVNSKEFTVGYQIGLQSEISKLIISAKFEGSFSKDEREFINTAAGSSQEIYYDNRPSLFLVGLGYKF